MVLYPPSRPTHDEEFQFPPLPAGAEGLLTVGTRQTPTAWAHVPATVLPAQFCELIEVFSAPPAGLRS